MEEYHEISFSIFGSVGLNGVELLSLDLLLLLFFVLIPLDLLWVL